MRKSYKKQNKKHKKDKKELALFKWSGYPDKFISWIEFSDLVNF